MANDKSPSPQPQPYSTRILRAMSPGDVYAVLDRGNDARNVHSAARHAGGRFATRSALLVEPDPEAPAVHRVLLVECIEPCKPKRKPGRRATRTGGGS